MVSRETRTVLTASFLRTRKLRKWSIEQGNLWEKTAQMYRLGLYLKNRDKWLSQSIARKLVITNSKQLEPRKNAEFYEKNYGVSKWIFREVHQQSLTEMEELRKFQSSTFDTLARRKLIEDQNIIMELSGRVQELQNEVNCMNDSKDFQDAESVRSGNSHVTSQPMSFPKHPIPEGMLRPSFVSPRRKEGPPCIWGYTWYIGKRFCKSTCIFISSLSSRIEPMGTTIEEPLHMSTAEKSERPEQNRDLRCQSGPSAKDSVIFSGGDSSKNYGADQRLQISDLHFDKFPTPATFCLLEYKVQDRGMYLFTIPYGSDAVDQRSGVGWFSGWIEIFGIYSWYFNAEFWSTWCEDCFSTEQNHT